MPHSLPALQVLPAEVLGDTLVVAPNGDLLSHDQRQYRSDLTRLQGILQSGNIHHLVVDLSGSDYFGSQMFSGLVSLKEELPDGGRAILCNLSDSQQVGLRVMKLDNKFESTTSRRAALKQVVRYTPADYIRMIKRPLAALLLIALIWGLYDSRITYRILGSKVKSDYDQVVALWNRYQAGPPKGVTEEEHTVWEKALRKDIAAARARLGGERVYMTKDAAQLGRAAAALDDLMTTPDRKTFTRFRSSLTMARYHLGVRTGIESPDLKLFDPGVLDAFEATTPATQTVSSDDDDDSA